jgi:hypothetical protein
MGGVAKAAGAIAVFLAGFALQVSELAFRGLDLLIGLLFIGGLSLAVFAYVRAGAQAGALFTRRLAVIGLGLNAIALVVHLCATRLG